VPDSPIGIEPWPCISYTDWEQAILCIEFCHETELWYDPPRTAPPSDPSAIPGDRGGVALKRLANTPCLRCRKSQGNEQEFAVAVAYGRSSPLWYDPSQWET
jgi:hypothetical protein